MFIPQCLGLDAPHQYWRLVWTAAGTGPDIAQATEVEMRATVGGADQCNGGTASASASTGAYTPDKAFNNSTAAVIDGWSSGTVATGCWLEYAFAAPVRVAEVWFFPSTLLAQSFPTALAFEYSDNGSAWIRVKEYTGLSWVAGTPQTFTL